MQCDAVSTEISDGGLSLAIALLAAFFVVLGIRAGALTCMFLYDLTGIATGRLFIPSWPASRIWAFSHRAAGGFVVALVAWILATGNW